MMLTALEATCYHCGKPVGEDGVINEDQGYAICQTCETDYQQALVATYPYGQCQDCGAEGFAWTCARGKQHSVMGWEAGGHHSEGGCRNWRDSDYHPDIDCDVCDAAEPKPLVARLAPVDDLDWLPF